MICDEPTHQLLETNWSPTHLDLISVETVLVQRTSFKKAYLMSGLTLKKLSCVKWWCCLEKLYMFRIFELCVLQSRNMSDWFFGICNRQWHLPSYTQYNITGKFPTLANNDQQSRDHFLKCPRRIFHKYFELQQ